jgi:hypothetical protein
MGFKVESPQSMRNRNTQDNNLNGIAKAIKEFADVQADRTKIKGQIAVNQLKASQNFFFKMQEKKEERDYLENLFNKQNGQQGELEEDMTQEVFGQKPRPSLVMGGKGYEVKTPAVGPAFWIQQLQKKKELGLKNKNNPFAYFSPTEKAWYDKAMGMGKDSSMDFLNSGSEMPSPGGAGQVAAESPYPEYPDAVQEDGVWKVIREGKKYRLEE